MNKLILALTAAAAALMASSAAFAGGDASRGAELAKKYNCASCHGADFKTPIDPSYPKLAGQHADYLAHALTAYKRGDKVMNGRNNAIMAGMAQPLSDRDMADIAAYLHGLPGPLVIRK
jgi:cytochrome c553